MAVKDSRTLRAWLRLLSSPLDRRVLAELCGAVGNPEELLGLGNAELGARFSMSPKQLKQLRTETHVATIDAQLASMDRLAIDLIPVADPEYPRPLFELSVRPPALFVRGKLEGYDALGVGIVGPRDATPYGLQMTERLCREFAPVLTIVSGAAMGVDSRAHATALDAGGRTIGVLGCGIDVDYPAVNRALRERISAGTQGALVSIFSPGTPPLPGHFPMRNVILAGLSLAVVVVEAGSRSGALTTARAAGEEGRHVYAVPRDVTRANSAGSNNLLRDGASVCTCAADVLSDLEGMLHGTLRAFLDQRQGRGQGATNTAPPTSGAAPGLEHDLLRRIQHHPISHDQLVATLVPETASIGQLANAILMLEMKGLIRQDPGRIYAPA